MDGATLPLGQHRLDPSPGFDPIRSLLHSLWTDTGWICERVASIASAGDDAAEVRRELAYLRGDTDDALQNLARLIELLLAGHAVDLQKCIGRGNSPPYFRGGVSMAADAIQPVGRHGLDPLPDVDPVRHFLDAGKGRLVRLDERRALFQRAWGRDPDVAAEELQGMRRLADEARRHVSRLIEVLLAGHRIDPDRNGPGGDSLRVFRQVSEAEWAGCADVDSLCKMLRHRDYGVAIRFSDRKWRLFGVACARRVMHAFRDLRTRGLVDVVERLADGLLSQEEAKRLWRQARNPPNSDTEYPQDCLPEEDAAHSAFQSLVKIPFGLADASRASESARWARRAAGQPEREEHAQANLLHDIFGSPFHPLALDPAWRTTTVVELADVAYEERELLSGRLDPSRLAVLADALEEAGCFSAELLVHLRSPGPHVRGCWALDLVLGKE